MAVLNTKLKRSIGITFTFKQYLSEFLHDLATSPTLTTAINDAPTMASLVKLANDFDLIGPAMGFAAKQTAYEILRISCEGLIAWAQLPAEDKTTLNDLVLNLTKYTQVGLEGERDFHFQVAVFNLSEVLSRILGEVVAIPASALGAIVEFEVFDAGSGYTNGTDVTVDLVSTELDDTTNGSGTVDIADEGVVLGTYTIGVGDDGGAGFYVGQIITVEDGVNNSDTPALAVVNSVA